MKSILLLLILIPKAYALEAVVTVLEAPLFKEKSYDSQVMQYKRKGDVIKVHPSLANTDKFDHMAPSPQKLKEIRERLKRKKESYDPLFSGVKGNTYALEDEFIPVIDRTGRTVYILSDHIYVYLGNREEFNQVQNKVDPTDYRLEEPLPKNYPLFNPSGYRGQVILGLTQPYYESYPYDSDIKNKGYMSPIDLNIHLSRQAPDDQQDRFYLGGTFNFRTFSNTYTFFNGRSSEEKVIKMGIGPFVSYDAFKGVKNRISLYGSINVNFFNQLKIQQSDSSGGFDERTYRSYSIAPKLGVQYHRKKILEDVDFVVGTFMEMEMQSTYKAIDAAKEINWWQNAGNDEFKVGSAFSMAAYLGIQTAY